MEHVHELVSVVTVFDKDGFRPVKLKWGNREYKVSEITLHYTKVLNGYLNHIFCLITNGAVMEISFDTKHLNWRIEGIKDSEDPA